MTRSSARRILSATLCRWTALIVLCLSATPADAAPLWVFLDPPPGWTAGFPVDSGVVGRLTAAGARVRMVSRYFYAVSVDFDGAPGTLAGVSGVREVRPVRTLGIPAPSPAPALPQVRRAAQSGGSPYGALAEEMTALGVPPLHDRGLTGQGVLIGVLDTGFDNLSDTGCLQGLDIRETRNFVRGGTDVSGDTHGSWVLACIAGNQPGAYLGPAHGASFLLAVTDDVDTETRADEDRWVAALEWCDSLGADIVSSSLVYNEFDTVQDSYTKAQMDGRTSMVAQAAEIAVERGMAVVNSAGNEGSTPWRIITTPGDAEHVITIGALGGFASGTPYLASFSSLGPTADGRIKPDLAAPGEDVSVPFLGSSSIFGELSGTSLAAPFVSGLCALLLEAHPGWTPAELTEALRNTARDLGAPVPDIEYGWGLPDGALAVEYSRPSVHENAGNKMEQPTAITVGAPRPNPFNPTVTIPFRLASPGRSRVSVHDITGRLVTVLADGVLAAGGHEAVWNARDCASGVYFIRVSAGGRMEVRKAALVK